MRSRSFKPQFPATHYSAVQFLYWGASTGTSAFAAAYLLHRGLSSVQIGTLLAISGLLACAAQLLLAAAADRSKRCSLRTLLPALSLLCLACFAWQLLPVSSPILAGLFYAAGLLALQSMSPLLSALCFSLKRVGCVIHYGTARSLGALASAGASLLFGQVIARLGAAWFPALLLLLYAAMFCLLLRCPVPADASADTQAADACTLRAFSRHERRFFRILPGIFFLAMYHAMTETYLLAIVQPLGGDSGDVGTALFFASILVVPVVAGYRVLNQRLRTAALLKIAAVSFLLQSICYCLARSIPAVLCVQLFQFTSYALLEPAQLHYANETVHPCDLAKGQASVTAAYALGCAAGNFAGGQLLSAGVQTMLYAGIVMALLGTLIVFLSLPHPSHRRTCK